MKTFLFLLIVSLLASCQLSTAPDTKPAFTFSGKWYRVVSSQADTTTSGHFGPSGSVALSDTIILSEHKGIKAVTYWGSQTTQVKTIQDTVPFYYVTFPDISISRNVLSIRLQCYPDSIQMSTTWEYDQTHTYLPVR